MLATLTKPFFSDNYAVDKIIFCQIWSPILLALTYHRKTTFGSCEIEQQKLAGKKTGYYVCSGIEDTLRRQRKSDHETRISTIGQFILPVSSDSKRFSLLSRGKMLKRALLILNQIENNEKIFYPR